MKYSITSVIFVALLNWITRCKTDFERLLISDQLFAYIWPCCCLLMLILFEAYGLKRARYDQRRQHSHFCPCTRKTGDASWCRFSHNDHSVSSYSHVHTLPAWISGLSRYTKVSSYPSSLPSNRPAFNELPCEMHSLHFYFGLMMCSKCVWGI